MIKQYTNFDDFERDYDFDFADPDSYLNRGSFGEVIKGWDVTNKQFVAIKRSLRPDDDSLQHEFEAARDLQHANVASYLLCCRLSARNVGSRDYLVMQYYPDGNLGQLIRKQSLTNEQQRAIVRGILEGLKYLHNKNRPHRDFKPANVLITRNRRGQFVPVITDFGSSKVTDTDGSQWLNSDHALTPSYAAPEQLLNGERVGFNIDLWAFGVVLYQMLTEDLPFGRLSVQQDSHERNAILRRMAAAELPERLDRVPQPYQAMIRRCLVRDQTQRVRRADELLDLLDEIPALLVTARRHLRAGDYARAQTQYKALLRLRPQHTDAQRELADCEQMMQESEEAATISMVREDVPPPPQPTDDATVVQLPKSAPKSVPVPTPSPRISPRSLPENKPVPLPTVNNPGSTNSIAGWQWAVLAACLGGILLAGFWFSNSAKADEPIAAPITKSELPPTDTSSRLIEEPTVDASQSSQRNDSLFTATKQAFMAGNLGRQTAFDQLKEAVEFDPTLADSAANVFRSVGKRVAVASPDLARQYYEQAELLQKMGR